MIPVTTVFLWVKKGEKLEVFTDQDKAIKQWEEHGGDLYIRVLKGKDE
jgi:hypothetical protein